jgi:hypothetical protein
VFKQHVGQRARIISAARIAQHGVAQFHLIARDQAGFDNERPEHGVKARGGGLAANLRPADSKRFDLLTVD